MQHRSPRAQDRHSPTRTSYGSQAVWRYECSAQQGGAVGSRVSVGSPSAGSREGNRATVQPPGPLGLARVVPAWSTAAHPHSAHPAGTAGRLAGDEARTQYTLQRTLELAAVLLAAAVLGVPTPQDALHVRLARVKLCPESVRVGWAVGEWGMRCAQRTGCAPRSPCSGQTLHNGGQ